MKPKNIKTLKALKNKLKKTLPEKISSVMQSYEDFSEQPVPEDAKGFTAHHNACKSAVVHAETLLKLARWTADEEIAAPVLAVSDNLDRLLEEAEAENDRYQDEED